MCSSDLKSAIVLCLDLRIYFVLLFLVFVIFVVLMSESCKALSNLCTEKGPLCYIEDNVKFRFGGVDNFS